MLRRVLVVIGGVVVAAVVAVSWLGLALFPVLSAAFGIDHARDLGMQSDRASFESFADQYGITRPSPLENYTLSSKHHWSGSIEVDGSLSEVAVDITQLDLGRVGVPGNVVHQVQTTLDGYLNKTIIEAGITIDSLELQEGAIYFKGTWPKTITADAPNANDIP